jgi:predicted kinase
MPGEFHVVCGKAGAGKTTLARQLGREMNAIVFVEDEWMMKLGFINQTVDDYRTACTKVRAVIGPLARELIAMGVNVVFDFGGNTRKHRDWVRTIGDAILHVIDVSEEEAIEGVRQRNVERPEGVFYGEVSDALVRAVNAYYEPPGEDEGFRLRSSRRPREA